MAVLRVILTFILAPLMLERVSARPSDPFPPNGEPSPNSNDDPFYHAPPGFESTMPGTILKHRRVPKPIAVSDVQIPVDGAWQLLYRTQDSLGNPDATVMTIIKPKNAKPNNLFSESFFTNTAWSPCNPSRALQLDSRDDNLFVQVQNLIVFTALYQGWYVSVSDDIGLRAAYTSGPQMGYATLDSIRAALKSTEITGLSENPIVTLNGYSAGAISVGWATEMQPQYAPELKIAGAALGGLTPNLSALVPISSQLDQTQQAIPCINGLANGYPNLTQWLNENLKESKREKFWLASKQCVLANSIYYGEELGSYFKRGLDSYMYDAVPHSVMKQAGTMGQIGTPKIPWYLYMTAGDNISPVHFTDSLYDKFCAAGASIEYERNAANLTKSLSHLEEGFIGYRNAIRWLGDVHAGKLPVKGCIKKEVYVPSAIFVIFDLLPLIPSDMLGRLLKVLWKLLAPSM